MSHKLNYDLLQHCCTSLVDVVYSETVYCLKLLNIDKINYLETKYESSVSIETLHKDIRTHNINMIVWFRE